MLHAKESEADVLEIKPFLKCLTLIQAFETLWAYYAHGDGQLYRDECNQVLAQLLECLKERRIRKLFAEDDRTSISLTLAPLKKWLSGKVDPEYSDALSLEIFSLLNALKHPLLHYLQIDVTLPSILDTRSVAYRERYVRWKAILPQGTTLRFLKSAEALLKSETQALSQTIVVMGDIRKSQDLMTYAEDPDDFAKNIREFLSETRRLIGTHMGLFDKFTGDGFLAYFDEKFCEEHGYNFVDCFVNFMREERDFAARLFTKWERTVRKLPAEHTGLAMGADIGRIRFYMEQNHFISVGDSVVWAARMASEDRKST